MKELKTVIQPFMLASVLDGLRQVGDLPALTVSAVDGRSIVYPEHARQEK